MKMSSALCSFSLLLSMMPAVCSLGLATEKPIPIQAPILKAIDGNLNVIPLVYLRKQLADVVNHNYGSSGRVVTLSHLVQQESQIDPVKRAQFLKKIMSQFVALAHEGSLLRGLFDNYAAFMELMRVWIQQRGKERSLAYAFATSWKRYGTELDIMVQHVHTLTEYRDFLMDLDLFLIDLLASLPKSYAAYEAAEKLLDAQTK